MITPLTENQQALIVKNVVAACKNIDRLNKTGYNFINLASGFIAHYNLDGFKDFYTAYSLRDDIRRYADINMWNNFRQGDQNYEYYMSRKAVYKAILEKL